jgi:hypothetical protein
LIARVGEAAAASTAVASSWAAPGRSSRSSDRIARHMAQVPMRMSGSPPARSSALATSWRMSRPGGGLAALVRRDE